MFDENSFTAVVEELFRKYKERKYKEHGDKEHGARSTAKLKPLHKYIADSLKSIGDVRHVYPDNRHQPPEREDLWRNLTCPTSNI